jgi:radical SAM protein with 4Fe4S-binding SPASM domain
MKMERSLGNMDLELFKHIIEQISGQQQYVALHHFGESLVHTGLAKAIEIAGRNGLDTGLSCNPPSLHPELSARLLAAGISNIVLSLDSLNAATYRDIRGPAAQLARADTNIRELIKLRNKGGYRTFITLQMINMHCNKTEADSFLQYCRDLSVDRGVVIRMGRWDFDDDYVTELGEFTSVGYDAYCARPWNSVVVLWDGRVVPCCHDYDGIVVIGDLRRQSLEEVWNSAEAAQFRKSNQDYKLCRQCAFSRWYREQQREREGFRHFHQERSKSSNRKEWVNPQSLARIDGRTLFDGFDVLMEET